MEYDAIVVGSGPNGLVAANLLADRGWRVVVLEGASTPGGAVRSCELIEPGYVNDVCSAFYPLGAASPVIARLGLEQHGLRWLNAPLVLAHPAPDGTCPVISRDLEETEASLDDTHPGDGAAWRGLVARWRQVERGLLATLFTPFPPLRALPALARAVPPREYADLARFLLLPVRRLGEEEFGGAPARRLIAASALHADLAPEANMSGFFGWLLCSLAQQVGFPVPEGGASALSGALVARLQSLGGTVLCGSRVTEILVAHRRAIGVRTDDDTFSARRAIIADTSVPALFSELLPEEHRPPDAERRVSTFQWDNGTVKVDWNLDGPIPWSAAPARRAGTVHLVESVDALTRASADLACGAVPRELFLIVGQQSMTDPTRQPAGKETAWAYTHVPNPAVHRAAEPLDVEAFVARVETMIEEYAPGFRALIRGRHVMAPADFQAENENLVGGALSGGTAQLHQQLVFRPLGQLARPETGVSGLFLGSASVHPGGGVHGAPGANAARAAIVHDRLRRVSGRRPPERLPA